MSELKPAVVVEGITGNGDYNAPPLTGAYALAFYGDFGAATVSLVGKTVDSGDVEHEVGLSSDWTFSGSLPGLESFTFPYGMEFVVRVTGADGSTNFGINAYPLRG
jgi:hypothetical protein